MIEPGRLIAALAHHVPDKRLGHAVRACVAQDEALHHDLLGLLPARERGDQLTDRLEVAVARDDDQPVLLVDPRKVEVAADFERGFIRAEVIGYDDYIACSGETKAKETGKMRVEGKEYVVSDGDIMHFRFNV